MDKIGNEDIRVTQFGGKVREAMVDVLDEGC